MSKLVASLALITTLSLSPHAASAQAPADSLMVRAVRAALRSDLRNFVTAQEAYFADNVDYARAARQLNYQPSSGNTVVLLTSTKTGHSEIAISNLVPGLVCGMFVGNSPPPLGMGNEGEPVCRGP